MANHLHLSTAHGYFFFPPAVWDESGTLSQQDTEQGLPQVSAWFIGSVPLILPG